MTTPGQAHFIMWASKSGVLDYAAMHRRELEENMKVSCARHRQSRSHRRTFMTRSTERSVCITKRAHTIKFDMRSAVPAL